MYLFHVILEFLNTNTHNMVLNLMDKNNMEILMLFPPQWTPVAPALEIPLLMAQLQKAGYDVKVSDLNIAFYNDTLNEIFLRKMLLKAQELLPELSKQIKDNDYSSKYIENYPIEAQYLLMKYSTIKNYSSRKLQKSEYTIKNVQEAIYIFKTKEKFYNPKMLFDAEVLLKDALEIAFLPYAPTKMAFDTYETPLLKQNYSSIKYHCLDKSTNIFLDYYPDKIKSLIDENKLSENTKYIAISINTIAQLIPGLTLGYLLKKQTSAHVTILGDYFRKVVDSLKKLPELFDMFCDSIMFEDCENSVIELAKCIENEISIEKVSGLIYKNEAGNVIVNPIKDPPDLYALANISLDGFDLSEYYIPEIVIPIKSNRNYYWNKCSFCDLDYGRKFNAKSPEKLIAEIKELKNKYNISHFEFIDSPISANYFDEFSDIILKENLDIKYFSFARLENTFTKKVLEKTSKSGLKMLLWEFESGSERIVELINKGIDFNNRLQIIKDSDESGIWNFVSSIIGFPSETKAEAMETINAICQNTDIMYPLVPSCFALGKNAKFIKNPQLYGLKNIQESKDDFAHYSIFESTGINREEALKMIEVCKKEYKKALGIDYPLWHSIVFREHFFLYVVHYGPDWIKNNPLFRNKKRKETLYLKNKG